MKDGQIPELRKIAEQACRAGMDAARSVALDELEPHDKGGALNLVTRADYLSDSAIAGVISGYRPTDARVSEESGVVPGDSGITWWIDPIDSTANFSRGLPVHSVSVAAADSEGPVAGAVGDTARGAVCSTARGSAELVFDEGAQFGRRATSAEAGIALYGAPSLDDAGAARAGDIVTALSRSFGRVRSPGSPALGLAWLAAGAADLAYYEMGFSDWDVMAGTLLCREAGLVVERHEPLGPGANPRLIAGVPAMLDTVRRGLGLESESDNDEA